jgi:tetratricopeptide (TPR) repeat protein
MELSGWVQRACMGVVIAQVAVISPMIGTSGGANAGSSKTNQLANAASDVIDLITDLSPLEGRDDPNELKRIYAGLTVERPSIIEESLPFYRCETLVRMNKRDEAARIAKAQIDRGLGKPDLLAFLLMASSSVEERNRVWDEQGKLLPLSHFGHSRDGTLSSGQKMVNPGPPQVPKMDVYISATNERVVPAITPGNQDLPGVLAAIGELYEKAGFAEDALNTYLEASYATGILSGPRLMGRLWLKIADVEKNRGDKKLALRAYFKAADTWHDYAAQAKEGAVAALGESLPPEKPTTAEPKLKKDTALTIAALYEAMNLHPMSLAVLVRCEKDTGEDLSTEKARILDEWKQIVEKVAFAMMGDCCILGQKVSEVKDWSRISIPRPTDTFWK